MLKIGVTYQSTAETLANLGLPPNRKPGNMGFMVHETDGRFHPAAQGGYAFEGETTRKTARQILPGGTEDEDDTVRIWRGGEATAKANAEGAKGKLTQRAQGSFAQDDKVWMERRTATARARRRGHRFSWQVKTGTPRRTGVGVQLVRRLVGRSERN